MAGLCDQREQKVFGRASLMGRDDVSEIHQMTDSGLEPVEAGRTGIAFVTRHDGAPLCRTHGRGATVGQQVDDHIVGMQFEEVVVRRFQQLCALLASRHADRLD